MTQRTTAERVAESAYVLSLWEDDLSTGTGKPGWWANQCNLGDFDEYDVERHTVWMVRGKSNSGTDNLRKEGYAACFGKQALLLEEAGVDVFIKTSTPYHFYCLLMPDKDMARLRQIGEQRKQVRTITGFRITSASANDGLAIARMEIDGVLVDPMLSNRALSSAEVHNHYEPKVPSGGIAVPEPADFKAIDVYGMLQEILDTDWNHSHWYLKPRIYHIRTMIGNVMRRMEEDRQP